MPVLNADDVALHYKTAGDGPPLLLIPGLASDHASWGPVAPLLSKNFALITPDNRGAGQTKTTGPVTIEAMARDYIALLDHLNIAQAHVLGHSMGGVIAMALTHMAPERVDRLVLAASCAKRPARAISVVDTILALREAGVSDELWLRSFFHWLFRPDFFDNKNAVDASIALAMAYPHAQSAENMRRQIDAIRAYDSSALPAKIDKDMLILTGAHDLMFAPAEVAESFADARHAEHRTLAGAAHSLHWDRPADFACNVIAFLCAD
ncbi:alpha/beta fold hydrolase [Hyphococcus luteus]|uniref:Lipolytic enzyme n=1 Tax=Hyphococcus luteus TaxID=2058213 RepID=A0A2S7K4Q2_9PROT|nr:alpha/beta fold hydrolase [Marinicaulis flavus]PQA87483.1 lipolytic enzyme [Marinicaulis flavus]